MSFTVHPARSTTHWQQGCEVLRRVYVGEGYTSPERSAQFHVRERLENEGILLVATRNNGDVIGTGLFLNKSNAAYEHIRSGEREFRLLAVHPNARSEGVGEALVRECIARADQEGANALVLWTRPTMLPAQRLYERLGFVHAPERDTWDERGFTRMVYVRKCTGQAGG